MQENSQQTLEPRMNASAQLLGNFPDDFGVSAYPIELNSFFTARWYFYTGEMVI